MMRGNHDQSRRPRLYLRPGQIIWGPIATEVRKRVRKRSSHRHPLFNTSASSGGFSMPPCAQGMEETVIEPEQISRCAS